MIERKFIKEGLNRSNLTHFLELNLRRAGFTGVDIQKTPVATRIAIRVERPGLVIGRKGSNIKKLTDSIQSRFALDNVQIKVEEVAVPELNAKVMARRIAGSLERGINFRRVIHFTLEKIMRAGAKGAEIVVSGKLVGKGGKGRSERVSAGYLKKAGEPAKLVQLAQTQAIKKAGVIGVTVRIVTPDVVFPDKVDVMKAATEAAEAKEAEAKRKADAEAKKAQKPEGGEKSGNTEAKQDKGNEPRGQEPATPAAKK